MELQAAEIAVRNLMTLEFLHPKKSGGETPHEGLPISGGGGWGQSYEQGQSGQAH